MPKYPNISDDNFYKKISNIYNKFKVPKSNKTIDDICRPKSFKLQLPQTFLSNFINPNTPYMGMLVYHRIGAGKTCTAVRVGEVWKKKKRIIVVVPASLKNNFRNELRSLCAGNNYLKEDERKELSTLFPTDDRYKELIEISDQRIDKYYEIYSYNKFIELANEKSINLKNALLIVDEVQNMVSEEGSFYNGLYAIIHSAPKDLRILLLSATPMFDRPNEIGLTLNLLRLPEKFPIGNEFNNMFIKTIKKNDGTVSHQIKNIDKFKQLCKGYVSYFRGAAPISFPKMTTKYVYCEMSDFQYSAYMKVATNEEDDNKKKILKKVMESLNIADLPNNFYIGSRMISNVVFPNKKINQQGFDSFTKKLIQNRLHDFSVKFNMIMDKIEKSSGKTFVYSGFKEYGGIKSFVKVLDAFGYKNYLEAGVGAKRYAVWSGDEDIKIKEEIRSTYNMKENIGGKKIKILLGSPSIKEGVSLSSVRYVHVMEPYWNQSRLDQVIGRASRFCSHMNLSENKRNVKVYIYVACAPGFHKGKNVGTMVDEHMEWIAREKQKLIVKFEKAIRESAVDCRLNKNANVYEGEESLECEV
jgi:hypothetical protein